MRRLAAVLLTSALALAGAVTVTPAHAEQTTPLPLPRHQLEAAPADLPTRATVDDPGADAEGGGATLRRLAELRQVTYRTPATTDGTLTVRATCKQLRNGNRPGRIQQRLVTIIDVADNRDSILYSVVEGRSGSFRLFRYDAPSDEAVRVRPEQVDTVHTYGAGGRISFTVSTEWLDARRIALTSYSTVGLDRTAMDITDSAALRVGPRR